MSAVAESPWGYEPANSGGLYLKIEPNTSVRLRLVGLPQPFVKEFNGQKSERWAIIAIEKVAVDGKILKAVKGWEFGVSIFKAIKALWASEDWGDPQEYDITVTRTGAGKESKYAVVPSPKKELAPEDRTLVQEANLDLVKMFIDRNSASTATNGPAGNGEYDPFSDE